MSGKISKPKTIWVISRETPETSTFDGSRSSEDTGGLLDDTTYEEGDIVSTQRRSVEVDKLKREMKDFLQAMREILDEAEQPESKMQLNEVELSVEINGQGQIGLLGIGGQIGGKGAMTLKFKRRDG